MNFKLPVVQFLLIFIYSNVVWTQSDGLTEIFQKKLGQITDKIFSWNPFSGPKTTTDSEETELLEIYDANFSSKPHHFYGCGCKSYNCSCCAHIEVPKTKFNHTGKFINIRLKIDIFNH